MSAVDGSEMDGYEALVSELRANPPVAPERLRQRVLEGAPAPRRQRSRKRKLTLVVVPAAIVLAVGAALVHGFVDSGSNTPSALSPVVRANPRLNDATSRVVHGHQAFKAASQQEGTLSGGTVTSNTYGLDQTAGRNTAVDSAPQALKALGPVRRSLTIPQNRLVHAVASLQVGVKSKDLSAKTNEASQIATSFGGYAQSIHYQASQAGLWGSASSRSESRCRTRRRRSGGSTDSARSFRSRSRPRICRRSSRTRRVASVRCAARSPSTRRRSRARRCPHPSGSTSRSSSTMPAGRSRGCGTPAPARSRPGRPPASRCCSRRGTTRSLGTNKSGSTRIGRLLGSAAHFLALEGIIVLYALIVLAPFLLLGALVWWIVHERRRREERLLASA